MFVNNKTRIETNTKVNKPHYICPLLHIGICVEYAAKWFVITQSETGLDYIKDMIHCGETANRIIRLNVLRDFICKVSAWFI